MEVRCLIRHDTRRRVRNVRGVVTVRRLWNGDTRAGRADDETNENDCEARRVMRSAGRAKPYRNCERSSEEDACEGGPHGEDPRERDERRKCERTK